MLRLGAVVACLILAVPAALIGLLLGPVVWLVVDLPRLLLSNFDPENW